jgi:hypothetical protein
VPGARIVNVDPLCHVVPPESNPELQADADWFNEHAVFESWDMLSGSLMPELGGSRAHLDIVGINYYWTNQWVLGRDEFPLPEDHPQRISLYDLITQVHRRYGGDILITETAHVDDMRPRWLNYITDQVESLLTDDVPLRGVCLYPILGMPEWHDQSRWTQMGLWDLAACDHGLERRLCQPMLQALKKAQRMERRIAHERASLWDGIHSG